MRGKPRGTYQSRRDKVKPGQNYKLKAGHGLKRPDSKVTQSIRGEENQASCHLDISDFLRGKKPAMAGFLKDLAKFR